MKEHFHTPAGGADDGATDEGIDPRLSAALSALDPGTQDASYWYRFHAMVMAGARDELARRRMLADVTVGDLVESWARMLVPTAVLAAALASLLLMRPDGPAAPAARDVPVALEELLDEELGGPAMDTRDQTMGVTFASGSF